MLVGAATFVYVALPFGAASDAKARNRTAADAAALAGAEGAKEDLLAAVVSGGLPESWTDLSGAAGFGGADAQSYAAYNEAELTEYWFDVTDGTAHATVQGHPVDGRVARSEAVAQVAMPDCDLDELDDLPEPEVPEPSDPPGQPDPPGPAEPPAPAPEPVEVELSCGVVDLVVRVEVGEDGPSVVVDPSQVDELSEAMEVRLVE